MASFMKPVTLGASTTVGDTHAGVNLIMSNAGTASTYTLPAASGTGYSFKFIVGAVNTSNYLVKVANATDTMDGHIVMLQDAADTVVAWETAAASDTITLNGTTTGGVSIGDYVELIDVASGQWAVMGIVTGSGTEATPFSATVS